MPQSILYRLCLDRTQSVERALEAWKVEHQAARAVRDMEDLIRETLDYPGLLRRLEQSTWDGLWTNPAEEIQGSGLALQTLFDRTLSVLRDVRALAQDVAQNTGHPLEGAPQLDEAVETVARMKAAFVHQWPWLEDSELQKAWTEYQRGEYLDLEDAFAQIAGVDRETWRRRVSKA